VALPPKGDPLRPLYLAASSTQGFGVLFLLFGVLSLVPSFLAPATAKRGVWPTIHISLNDFFFYFGPGVAYLLCGIFIKRKRLWAIIVALVLASLHLTLFSLGTAEFLIAAVHPRSTVAMAPAVIALGMALLFLQLVFHLSKCLKLIKRTSPEVDRGFEPLPISQPPIKTQEH
jgi:hypothetical protein